MKGMNEIRLNQSSMIEAIQYWLDSVLVKQDMKVTNVKADTTCGLSHDFVIKMSEKEEEDE